LIAKHACIEALKRLHVFRRLLAALAMHMSQFGGTLGEACSFLSISFFLLTTPEIFDTLYEQTDNF
jgi:hypothetical protein